MSDLKRRLLSAIGLRNQGHPLVIHLMRVRRLFLRTNGRIRDRYLAANGEPKLQIGGGWNRFDGWLNTDLNLIPRVVQMDATHPFPFADNTFQYIYTEHMIEHVPYTGGVLMLRECYRVMRKGGVIRITTPDLATIIGLYATQLSALQHSYLDWISKTFLSLDKTHTRAEVVNALSHMWGHQFIYDEITLREAMRLTGFDSVTRHRLGQSESLALKNLENTGRYPEGLLEFESVSLEGIK